MKTTIKKSTQIQFDQHDIPAISIATHIDNDQADL